MTTAFVRPENPAAIVKIIGRASTRPAPSAADTVAIVFTHDWGPLGNEADGLKVHGSLSSWEGNFGISETSGQRAVLQAFYGSGVPGEPGAGGVLGLRMAGSSVARATATVNGAGGTPAVSFPALWNGALGNTLAIIVEDDPQDPDLLDRVRVLRNGSTVERFSYPINDLAALKTAVEARPSNWLRGVEILTDASGPLAQGQYPLTGGNSGTTLTSTDYLNALAQLDFAPISALAFENLTDAAVLASVKAWIIQQAEQMRPIDFVFGGPANEGLDAAIARTAPMRNEHVLSVGIGSWHDDLLGRDLSTAEMAPRIAGISAARGREQAMTLAPLAGISPVGVSAPLTDELAPAWKQGIIAFRRVSFPGADYAINKSVTSWTSNADPDKPVEIFANPRYVRIINLFIRANTAYGEQNYIGRTRVTRETKDGWRTFVETQLTELLESTLVLPDPRPFVEIIETDDVDLAEAIPYEFGWKFSRDTNFLLGNGVVR